MSFFAENALSAALAQYLPADANLSGERCRQIYEENCDRMYSFAFWMTNSEMQAEEISERSFVRAFGLYDEPSAEALDRALVHELTAAGIQFGRPTLRCRLVMEQAAVRHNTLRTELEQAILQLPHTERMIYCMHDGDGYSHARVARTLGIREEESREGLTQARLRLRELLCAYVQRAIA